MMTSYVIQNCCSSNVLYDLDDELGHPVSTLRAETCTTSDWEANTACS